MIKNKTTAAEKDGARHARTENLRRSAQDRHLTRIERLETKAALMVGELAGGKFYTFPVGGKYFESSSEYDVVQWIIRNKWVR